MKGIKDMWRYSIVFLLMAGPCSVWAQNVVFIAEAGANKIGIKDNVQVQYTVKDAQNLQSISPPLTSDFAIVGGPYQSSSSSVNVIGNRMVQSQSITLTYVLHPRHEGNFIIPPVVAKDAAGHTYQSNTITIQVVGGSMQQQRPQQQQRDPFGQDDDAMAMLQRMQQMQQQQMQMMQQSRGLQQQQQQMQQQRQQQQQADPPVDEAQLKKDLFIKVTVDKNKVHEGEQVTASYKLYTRIPMQVDISKLPSLNGFWTQDFDIPRPPKPTEETYNGRKYQVLLLKKSALFPQQTGTLELDEAEAKGVARIIQTVKRRLSDIFGDPFGGTMMMNDPAFNNSFYTAQAYRDVKVDLKSEPVKITVEPLTEKGKPADYGGAVGNFTISSKTDKQNITTDDVATLTYTITGTGNLKLIEAPKPVLPDGLETYDPKIVDTITGRSNAISGSKIISYAITPHTPGDYDIPGISFTYFDPKKNAYVTAHTEPIKLHVTAGKNYNTRQNSGNAAMKDIHDNITTPINGLIFNSKPLVLSGGYLSLYLLPLLALLFILIWKRRDEEQSKDTVKLRSKRANKIALQRLVTAKRLLQQGSKTPFYEEISKAIWLYLSDKLNIPLSSLSRDAATEAMSSRKIPATLQKELDNVIWECETALYASSGGSKQMEHTYQAAIKVISDLEDVFKA